MTTASGHRAQRATRFSHIAARRGLGTITLVLFATTWPMAGDTIFAGDCCEPGVVAGCGDARCAASVCQDDPFCCQILWDGICAEAAEQACPPCFVTPPVNDSCSDAMPALEGATAFSTAGATTDGVPHQLCDSGPCHGTFNAYRDIWFTYAPASNGETLISTCGDAGFDAKIIVYEGCDCQTQPDDLAACSDACFLGAGGEVLIQATKGSCYLIRIGSAAALTGEGMLTIGPPVNVCPGLQSCCMDHLAPGCEDVECCATVCKLDPFCCDVRWDSICVDEAMQWCQTCGSVDCTCLASTGGPCCDAHEGSGCDEYVCCQSVCSWDEFCCLAQWDELCATAAGHFCQHICDEGEPFFMGIGDLAGGGFNSRANDISADGAVVVGHGSTVAGVEALRWTLAQGVQGIGDLPGGSVSSSALAISHDGTAIVGHGETATALMQAFRWTQDEGMIGLGFLATPQSIARGASLDGSAVVGQSGLPEPKLGGTLPFRWTMKDGMVSLESLPGGTTEGVAHDVSADGAVIVGYSSGANGIEAFRWTDPAQGGGGMVGLGDLPGGGFSSAAFAVSADGSSVVGQSFPASLGHAFRWTEAQGMIDLGTLPATNPTSIAFDVSADGSIVVGEASSSSNFLSLSAFIWNQRDGMQELQIVLSDLALDVDGWILAGATGISADGRTIVGWGLNPSGQSEGWIALLGAKAIPGDLDADGVVGPADLAELLSQWGECRAKQPCTADIAPPPAGDGTVGPADLAELLANWS